MPSFSIGDKVRVVAAYQSYSASIEQPPPVGLEGTVIHMERDETPLVQFPPEYSSGHDGDGRGNGRSCWYFWEMGYLELIIPKTIEEKVLDKIKLLDERYAAHMKLKKETEHYAKTNPVTSVESDIERYEYRTYSLGAFRRYYPETLSIPASVQECERPRLISRSDAPQAPRTANSSRVPQGLTLPRWYGN